MPVLMFWNLAGNSPFELIAAACREHAVDILILAERPASGKGALIRHLNSKGETRFFEFDRVPSALAFYSRLPTSSIQVMSDDGRIAIRRVRPPLGCEFLVVGCHLPSKLYQNDDEQYYFVRSLRQLLATAERTVGHQNSIIIGDLNLNPFDTAMVAADGLHAVMDKQIALRTPRIVQGKSWDFFYNPMWSRLGDESRGPAGTYYYSGGGRLVAHYWNTFDQVLLRPALLPYYDGRDLKVLTSIDGTALVTANKVGPVSDHLPIIIKLNTERGRWRSQ